MNANPNIKGLTNLSERLVRFMCEHPQDAHVKITTLSTAAVIQIQAHCSDTRRLIGKHGRNFEALAYILKMVGRGLGFQRVNVPQISEPRVGKPKDFVFKPRADWPREQLIALVTDTMEACFHGSTVELLTVPKNEDTGMTTLVVARIGGKAPEELVEPNEYFGRIFDAIGRTQGRAMSLTLEAAEAEDQQPETAAGRFTGVIKR